ncbi:MAG TPA: alpha/beta fold hydrolase [Woeseiaceae bacterium]|jgi:putative redox protein|nr:alpha/beta fold hydrolase [Gammaproteobacteria bacterium]MDH3860363.1 alpha/beta fold hydrolase [Gammaproteobacteria bacterium]HKJ20493.1 alpha/beta fold hydrolase [Woeseiaceae bacterium]
MQSKNISFPNADGQALAGILDMPDRAPRAYALFAHCFTCSKNLKAATNIARAMTDAGIAVLRFDFTGLGKSEGAFEDTSFSSNIADLLSAVDWLEKEHRAPEILFGHSLGGTAVLQAASRIPSAVAVATIGSPADPEHVTHMLTGAEDALAEDGVAEVQLGGRPFRIRKEFVDDLAVHDLPATIASLRKALLVMHAPLDDIVEIDNASELFRAAKHPKSFVSLDKADHLLSRSEDSRYAGEILSAWAKRYLPNDVESSGLRAASGEVVARTGVGGFATEVRAGKHAFLADEPVSVGGTDKGPTPYDLLAAALATCTTMTLRMYAAHKKLDLESATVRVSHGRVHADDCVDCEQQDGQIHEFNRELLLEGDLTEAQQARMLEIADRCPVHKTLHSEIKVRTRLAG